MASVTPSAWVVAACVAAAGLLLSPTTDRRLRAATRLGSSPRAAPSPRRRPGRRRRTGPDDRAEVAALATELAVLLRAGLAPAPAWAALAAETVDGRGLRAAAVAAAGAAASTGEDVAAAVRAVADGPATPPDGARALRGLAAAWAVGTRSGAPTADVLQRYAEVLRADGDADDARDAALAAPRATARVLTALPPAGLLLGALVGADPVGVLLGTTPGRISAVVGAVCALAGWWWTRRLLAAARRATA